MSENEINNYPVENNSVPAEEVNLEPNEDKGPKEGFSFNWIAFALGVAFWYWWCEGNVDWIFYIYLAIVVLIHELGHVIIGTSFGCRIREMQVFFIPFLTYIPKQVPEGGWWRKIKWSLGILPLGGITMFTTQGDGNIGDKLAWQRLLISAAGVLFNFATFLILYIAMQFIPEGSYDLLMPLASVSLILGILNIIPVYPLDGGAIMFALFEIITGRKPSPKFTMIFGRIGFLFIIIFFWFFPEWLNRILDIVFGALF